MTDHSRPVPRRRWCCPPGVFATAIAAVVLAACASGGGTVGTDEVPVLITTPVLTTGPTTSVVAPTTSLVTATSAGGAAATSDAPTSSTVDSSASTTTGASDPGASTDPTTAVTRSTTEATSGATTTSPAASSTSTSLDIEPPPSSPPPTSPVPTAAQPPDTVGGGDPDYLLTPTSIVGLQFGATTATVLDRMVDLLGDPLSIAELAECAGGPAYGYQWFNAAVIVTDEGLAYYIVGMDLDLYGQAPIPGWHTASGVEVGADQAALDAAWPGEVAYEAPQDGVVTFTVTGGPDAGISGRLYNGVVQALSAGTTTC